MLIELPFKRVISVKATDGDAATDTFVTPEWPATLVMWLDSENPQGTLWLMPKMYEEGSWDPLFLKIPLVPLMLFQLARWKDQPLRNIRILALAKPTGSSGFTVGKRRICTVRWDQHNMAGMLVIKLPTILPFEGEGPAIDLRIALDKNDFFDSLELLRSKATHLLEK